MGTLCGGLTVIKVTFLVVVCRLVMLWNLILNAVGVVWCLVVGGGLVLLCVVFHSIVEVNSFWVV